MSLHFFVHRIFHQLLRHRTKDTAHLDLNLLIRVIEPQKDTVRLNLSLLIRVMEPQKDDQYITQYLKDVQMDPTLILVQAIISNQVINQHQHIDLT